MLLLGSAMAMTSTEYLKAVPAPQFKPGHTLPVLTCWGQAPDPLTSVEFTEHWGYAFDIGTAAAGDIATAERWPDSTIGKTLRLAIERKYPSQLYMTREELNPDQYPMETWALTSTGALANGQKVWSPEAPDTVLQQIADKRGGYIKYIKDKGVNVAAVLNGGEWGLGNMGMNLNHWTQDPRTTTAVQSWGYNWFNYISFQKARHEQKMTNAARAAAPGSMYFYYPTGGGNHRKRYGGWTNWAWDYKYMRTVSNYPSSELYFNHFNDGWTDYGVYHDLLTMYLGARGYEISLGDRLAYNWVCAGWTRTAGTNGYEPVISDQPRYMGFLKCAYTSGMIGGIASYFAYEMNTPVTDPANPPAWLWQRTSLSHVHALFSHLEPFLRNGELLPGPKMHLWSGFPAYEFPTGFANTHVLARKLNNQNKWLVTAWAADNVARDVKVTVPVLGDVQLRARPEGSVYYASLAANGRLELALIDRDGLYPSKSAAWLGRVLK